MEPQKEPPKSPEPPKEEKERKRRFQIVKLEERIAPTRCTDNTCRCVHGLTNHGKNC
jgi:hypothetical protein